MNKALFLLLGFMLAIPYALADTIPNIIHNTFLQIIGIGDLGFLGVSDHSLVVGFVRIMVWILIFTLFFAVAREVKSPPFSYLKKNQAMVVAFCLATIAAIFVPAPALLAVGAGWATAIAVILIGVPIVAVAFALQAIPGNGQPETKFTVLLKLALCFLLFWILSSMSVHIGKLGGF